MKNVTWINLILGIWLIVAPFAIGYSGMSRVATAEDIVLGILLIGFSWWIVAAVAAPVGTAWFQLLCGIWILLAPFVLGYRAIPGAMANDVVCGVIAIVVSLVESRALARTPTVA
ncbi:MAG: SPW repeat protein [Betaproteobacteria bacterium]